MDAIVPCDSSKTQDILKTPVAWCQEISHSRGGRARSRHTLEGLDQPFCKSRLL